MATIRAPARSAAAAASDRQCRSCSASSASDSHGSVPISICCCCSSASSPSAPASTEPATATGSPGLRVHQQQLFLDADGRMSPLSAEIGRRTFTTYRWCRRRSERLVRLPRRADGVLQLGHRLPGRAGLPARFGLRLLRLGDLGPQGLDPVRQLVRPGGGRLGFLGGRTQRRFGRLEPALGLGPALGFCRRSASSSSVSLVVRAPASPAPAVAVPAARRRSARRGRRDRSRRTPAPGSRSRPVPARPPPGRPAPPAGSGTPPPGRPRGRRSRDRGRARRPAGWPRPAPCRGRPTGGADPVRTAVAGRPAGPRPDRAAPPARRGPGGRTG